MEKRKRQRGGPKEVIASFAREGLGFMKDMASELDFTSSCVFLLSVTLRLSSLPLSRFQIVSYCVLLNLISFPFSSSD